MVPFLYSYQTFKVKSRKLHFFEDIRAKAIRGLRFSHWINAGKEYFNQNLSL